MERFPLVKSQKHLEIQQKSNIFKISEIWKSGSVVGGGRYSVVGGGRFFKLLISGFGAQGRQNIILVCENNVIVTAIHYTSQTNEENAGKNFVKPKAYCKRSANDPPTPVIEKGIE